MHFDEVYTLDIAFLQSFCIMEVCGGGAYLWLYPERPDSGFPIYATGYVFIVNRPKTENETVYYNVDYIHNAIYENKEISFQYAEWTTKKEFKLKKEGAFYVVSPWALTWDDENYYLVAYDEVAGIIKHYRVDKMQRTKILKTDRKGEESFKNFDLASYAKKTFGMYGGIDAEVTLECKNELAGVVIDRFGHDVWLIPQGEDYFKIKVLVSVRPQFFGWITGIGPGMKYNGLIN